MKNALQSPKELLEEEIEKRNTQEAEIDTQQAIARSKKWMKEVFHFFHPFFSS